MRRVTLAGSALDGFPVPEPAASVRLLLPEGDRLVIPRWTGNEFLFADGARPTIRTFTPRRFDPDALELDLDILLHPTGAASAWAAAARLGAEAAVSGPGRGYRIDPDAPAFHLFGDETAIPAISQLLEHLPQVPIAVDIEIAHDDARVDLRRDVDLRWHVAEPGAAPGDRLVAAAERADLPDGVRVWAAGEAAAMQRIRRLLRDDRGLPRAHLTVRGYWKRRDV